MNPINLHLRSCLRALPLLVLFVLVALGSGPAVAGPGMPDPRQMSGIPRADPQIPAGEITVRVLRGGFDQPALDAVVELELRSADGRRADLRRAEAGNQGRAYFRELTDYAGGQAVARVVLDGETIRSQQIDVLADTGTAVMLVKGAPKRGAAQEISLPGIVFDFDKTPAGSLMVGVFDLQSRQGLEGQEIELHVTAPDGQTSVRTVKTEAAGQGTFEGLAELPPGAVVRVEARLDEDGEPYRSMEFTLDPTRGQAVVLARGRMASAGANPHEGGAPGAGAGAAGGAAGQGGDPHSPQLTRLPPPQIDTATAPGTVSLLLVDGKDQPIANQAATIVKKDFSGTETRYEVVTGADGVASADELPVVADSLYYVGVKYDGAPYTSRFFGLDKRGGVKVVMRVWPVTSDRSVVKSAIQFEVIEDENDAAQIIQVYEVLVGGDKAFWPGEEPLHIEGLPGAKGMVVLRGAEDWLDHEEQAPFATLAHPITPGEVAALSVGYIVDGHGGQVHIDWTPPFPVIESALVISDQLELDAPGAKISDRKVPERPGLDYIRVAHELGQSGTGPIVAEVSGLRQTEKLFGLIALAAALVVVVVVVIALALTPRRDARKRLLAQRDELLAAVERTRDRAKQRRMVTALDRVYRQLAALDELERKRSPSTSEQASAGGA
ncbi:MAG: hypothetical protein AB1Z98_07240 [Nannocystaceae bacterium]